MQTKQNFIAYNRGFAIIKQHAGMILKPAIISILAVLVWLLLHYYGIHFSKEGSELMAISTLVVIGIIYAVKAASVLDKVWEEYKKISIAVVAKDRRTFLLYRDEQIPLRIHVLLGALGLLILQILLLLDYPDILTGIVSIFDTTFALSILAVVAIDLDDPKKSIWFKEKIPPDWMSADIEKEFVITPGPKGETLE